MPSMRDALSNERYDQFSVEEWVKEFWEERNVYRLVKEKASRSAKKLYFLDGPPYTSAPSIHVGTAWNKIIKDVILRYYRMMGFNVWDRPGFDTHGLPIEVMIEKSLGIKEKGEITDRVGIDRFVEECKRFAERNLREQTKRFKELGVFMDWDNPYVTFKDEYIESGWWLFKKAWEKGLLDEDVYVVHWCPRCQTTLADYEVSEYRDLEDPSIYVKFPVKGRKGESLLIWTTTPWTLPANAFVMAHPDLTYVRVRVGGEVLILAKARVEEVMREAGVKEYEILEEMPGRELEGLEYLHPLEDLVDAQRILARYHRVVMAPEAVTPHEGTGLVHSAPGHGDVDFEIGKRLGVPVISLVGDDGRMLPEAGRYAGLYFRTEANEAIIRDLRERGALFHEGRVVHRYPVCWRCKTPLLLRATKQWVIRVSKIRDELIRNAETIEWVPRWAKERFMHLLRNVRDWVISRQRFWGIPLPIWVCERCGYRVVIGSLDELEKLGGRRPRELHRPWVDEVTLRCPKCGGVMRRVPDVADVWFDSGIAFYASLGYPKRRDLWERLKPVDFIVEGHDQIRGWFFSLLRSGVIGFGEAPYRRVLVHGFALDEQGREMHKSLGNYIDFDDLIKRIPRDVVRLWTTSNTVWEDLRFSWREMERMWRDFTVIWNVFTFMSMYMGLDAYDPTRHTLERYAKHLRVEDKWLLSRVNNFLRKYHKAMASLLIHEAARLLREFIINDVSRWYLRLVRRRVWTDEETPDKMAAYATLYYAIRRWLAAAAPFIPFLTEYVYQKLFREAEEGPESVHLLDIPEADITLIDERLEELMGKAREIVEAARAARMKAGLKIRRPVSRIIVATSSPLVRDAARELGELILEEVNAKSIEVLRPEALERVRVYRVEPNYREIGPLYKRDSPKVYELLRERGEEVARALMEKGRFEAEYKGVRVVLEPRHVKVVAEYPEWLSVEEGDDFIVAVDTRVTEEEILEGLAREVVRRIQFMRKEAGLSVTDYIEVWVDCDDEMGRAIGEKEDYIKSETRAIRIHRGEPPSNAYSREWEVDGRRLRIGIVKAGKSPTT
ncbi:MAG: isoleucine--tRNA ligase [Desulfurococcales archaeon]|nr:isoleucine--tRNA ligase [Desulfurococcales archaeon]